MQNLPIFSYFDGPDQGPIAEFIAHWRAVFPHFAVLGPADARKILDKYFSGRIDTFESIQIPAARADISRYLLLYEFGGLYVDCHMGYRQADEIKAFVEHIKEYDAVFFDNAMFRDIRSKHTMLLINSFMFFRPKNKIAYAACRVALRNLTEKRQRELAVGFEPYHIWSLCGPGVLNAVSPVGLSSTLFSIKENSPLRSLLEGSAFGESWSRIETESEAEEKLRSIRREALEKKILLLREEDFPAKRNVHKTYYNEANRHWSERQKSEPLFLAPTPTN